MEGIEKKQEVCESQLLFSIKYQKEFSDIYV